MLRRIKNTLFLVLALVLVFKIYDYEQRILATEQEISRLITTSSEQLLPDNINQPTNEPQHYAAETTTSHPKPESTTNTKKAPPTDAGNTKAEHLPILLDWTGNWLDQNGEVMDPAECGSFFWENREYAKVVTAINRLCDDDIGYASSGWKTLDSVSTIGHSKPHDADEYEHYEWILHEMPADYDWCLNDLYAIIGDEIDLDASPAASVSSCIVLGKLLEFQDNGIYDTVVNHGTTLK